MPSILIAEQELRVGEATVIEAPAPTPPFEAVFEDDGDAGYFYALDHSRPTNPIVDACHIYDVEKVPERRQRATVQIVWSPCNTRAALLINEHPHAVFDFAARRGYCLNDFPPEGVAENWSPDGHAWNDAALEAFQ